jgi:hypothetical protein
MHVLPTLGVLAPSVNHLTKSHLGLPYSLLLDEVLQVKYVFPSPQTL